MTSSQLDQWTEAPDSLVSIDLPDRCKELINNNEAYLSVYRAGDSAAARGARTCALVFFSQLFTDAVVGEGSAVLPPTYNPLIATPLPLNPPGTVAPETLTPLPPGMKGYQLCARAAEHSTSSSEHATLCLLHLRSLLALLDRERSHREREGTKFAMYSLQAKGMQWARPDSKGVKCMACEARGYQSSVRARYGYPNDLRCAYHTLVTYKGQRMHQNTSNGQKRKEKRQLAFVSDAIAFVADNDHVEVSNAVQTLFTGMTAAEAFLLDVHVKGVSESRPPIAVHDFVRLRVTLPDPEGGGDIRQEVVGCVSDIVMKDDIVKLRLPGPAPAGSWLAASRRREGCLDKRVLPYLGLVMSGFCGVGPGGQLDPGFEGAESPRFDLAFGGVGEGKALRLCRRALDDAEGRVAELARILAPSLKSLPEGDGGPMKLPRPGVKDPFVFFYPDLNRGQMQAIWDIVTSAHRPFPYILFGPPGTGKTLTFVEAVVQLSLGEAPARILVTAPSDAACDVLAKRLAKALQWQGGRVGNRKTKLLRFNNIQRKPESLPVELTVYSNLVDGQFSLLSTLLGADVVVCTCVCAALLPWESVRAEGDFTHLFVDESCQATEPEVLIPLSKVSKDCNVVLGGDPRQLGPQIYDPSCAEEGLALSLLERLMALPIYESLTHAVSTTLTNNYRSHPALLDVPSSLFYENKLVPCATSDVTDSALAWEGLGNKSFPLLFYDAKDGEGVCEVDTPSFFNRHECEVVVDFVGRLVESETVKVQLKDIVVISPFRAQVLKLRKALREAGFGIVGVGQVENYQGGEAMVTIISAVMSGPPPGATSKNFVDDSKKFNVALSRAKALCVVVGNIDYLRGTGSYWAALIEHCSANNAICGDSTSTSSTMASVPGRDDDHYAGVDALLEYVEKVGLGAACETDKLERALRGYYNTGDEWRVQL